MFRPFTRRQPSPATVMAAAALFVALGGAGYAATGGTFILGHANTATTPTKLTANIGNQALQVENTNTTSGASALGLTVANGHAPFSVNSGRKVANLNADKLDGVDANGLGRIAMASTENLTGGFSFSTLTTVTLTAPATGFVRLDGSLFAWDNGASTFCSDCELAVRIHDVTAGADSPRSFFIGGDGSHSSGIEVPVSWVFPVTSGAHSYTLDAGQVDFAGGPLTMYNPVLVAQFVPYGGSGLASSLGASKVQTASGARRAIPGTPTRKRSP